MTPRYLLLLLMMLMAGMSGATEPKPVWELGIGMASYMSPHYLGSGQSTTYVVPAPFLVYRGERIRAERGGLLSRIYDSDIMDIRVNFSGSLPVNSEDNDARIGMPDLDLMLEAGPTLQFHLHEDSDNTLRFDVPLRAAFSVSDSVEYRGLIFNPGFYYAHQVNGWRLSSTLGPVFSSEAYQDYFYEVDAQYATLTRPAFNAGAGYTGLRHSIGVSRQFGEIYTGSFLNYYNLNHAENDQSPLMLKSDYLSLSFVLIWIFAESDRVVEF